VVFSVKCLILFLSFMDPCVQVFFFLGGGVGGMLKAKILRTPDFHAVLLAILQ
jgi:hypothetical protein